jgi:hypothetical protein
MVRYQRILRRKSGMQLVLFLSLLSLILGIFRINGESLGSFLVVDASPAVLIATIVFNLGALSDQRIHFLTFQVFDHLGYLCRMT